MKGRLAFLSWLVLLALLVPGPARILAGSAAQGTFHEDFTTYQHLEESRRVDWDTFGGYARLLLSDGEETRLDSLLKLDDGSALVSWMSSGGGISTLYLQHFDVRGNPLWPEDRVVFKTSEGQRLYGRTGDLALDGGGNIYITYAFAVGGDYQHAFLQKLDAQGLPLWGSPLDLGLDPEGRSALAVGVDGSFGLASSPIDGRVDVRYYSPSGTLGWQKEISHTGHTEDLAIDAAGNLMVAWGVGVRDTYQLLVQRISRAGDLLWPAPVQVSANDAERIFGYPHLAIREDGSVFVAWYEEGDVRKILLQRISADGLRLWPADVQVNNPSEFSRHSFGLTLTPVGDALLWWYGSPAESTIMRRVTADGRLLEEEQVMPYEYPGESAVNRLGEASLVRRQEGAYTASGWLQSFQADGTPVNQEPRRIGRGRGTADQRLPAVVAGPGDTAQVAWLDSRRSTLDAVLQRFDSTGQPLTNVDVHLYRQVVEEPYRVDVHSKPVIAGDAQGNLVTAWMTPNTSWDEWTLQVMKILPDGTAAWDEPTRLTTLEKWKRPALAVDSQGNIYVAWSIYTENVHDVLQVQKLSPQGDVQWAAPVNPKVSPPREGADWESQDWPILDAGDDGSVLVAWQHADFFAVDDMNQAYVDGRMQRISPQGKPMWGADVVAPEIGGGSEPDLRFNRFELAAASADTGGGAYLAWLNSKDIVGWRLQVMRYGRDGQAAWDQPLIMGEGQWSDADTPANVQLSGLGQSAVIAWQGRENGSGHVARVGPEYSKAWERGVSPAPSTTWNIHELNMTVAGLSDGGVMVAYSIDQPVTGMDVYMLRLDEKGDTTPVWESPRSVVNPDYFFAPSGWVMSDTVAQAESTIKSATLTADFDLNGGTLRFQLSADGGAHWETVVSGQEHAFAHPGKHLRWRADFMPGRNFTASPVLYDLTIRYGEPPPPLVLDQQLWLPVIHNSR